MVFHRNQGPQRLVHRFNLTERTIPEDSYLSGPYALDPLYRMFLQGAPSGAYWLKETAPDDFFESEYYRQFYSCIGLSDEIDVLWRMDDDTALIFFLERSVRNPAFLPVDLMAIDLVIPFVHAACGRHHQLASREPRPEDLTHRKVQGTIKIHRKNIHRKLDIGSQAELFSLFINCIPFAEPGSDADPLEAYQRRPGRKPRG